MMTLRTATALGLVALAQTALAACPYTPDQMGQVLGGRFGPGQEEPSLGSGSSCKYSARNPDLSVWVIVLKPGPDQDMMRTMTAGGPKARFEAIAGASDGAARVRGADDSLVDISYKRAGHVVFLRGMVPHEPDSKKREAAASDLAQKLLKLPRLP